MLLGKDGKKYKRSAQPRKKGGDEPMGFLSSLLGGAEEPSENATDPNAYESWHAAVNAIHQSGIANNPSWLATNPEQWVIDELNHSAENLANKAADLSGGCDSGSSGMD